MPPLQPGGHPLVVEGDSGFGFSCLLKSERSAGGLVKFYGGIWDLLNFRVRYWVLKLQHVYGKNEKHH